MKTILNVILRILAVVLIFSLLSCSSVNSKEEQDYRFKELYLVSKSFTTYKEEKYFLFEFDTKQVTDVDSLTFISYNENEFVLFAVPIDCLDCYWKVVNKNDDLYKKRFLFLEK